MMTGGDAGTRLGAFLDWAKEAGVGPDRVQAWRPVAEKLLALAGGGRVLEGHILSLIDASHESPERIALTEEVGEALLRYQALAKLQEKPTRELPKIIVPAIQRQAAQQRARQTPMPRPPSSPHDPDHPTDRIRPTTPMPADLAPSRTPERTAPNEERVVSFTPTPVPIPTVPTPPNALAVATPQPGRRSSNVHFRCPKCKVMVAANDEGVCPTCGTRPPKAVETTEPPPRAIWRRALLVAIVIAVAVFVVRVGGRLVDRLAHPAVVGSYPARRVGLELSFAEEWRRQGEGQIGLASLGLDEMAAVERFSRDDGDLAIASAPRPADFTDARLRELGADPEVVAASIRRVFAGVRLETCTTSGRQLRCTGTDGDRPVVAYVVLLPKQVAVVVLRATGNLESAAARGDALVESLEPL